MNTQPDMGTVTQAKTDSDPTAAHRPDDPRVMAMTPGNGQHVHATGHYHPRRPLWLRALNLGGHVWQRLGMPLVRLNADQLLEAACQHTGLHDFGTIPFRESLQLRCRAVNTKPDSMFWDAWRSVMIPCGCSSTASTWRMTGSAFPA